MMTMGEVEDFENGITKRVEFEVVSCINMCNLIGKNLVDLSCVCDDDYGGARGSRQLLQI